MAKLFNTHVVSVPLMYTIIHSAAASPIQSSLLHKRQMTSGARAGLGIGIAVVVIAVLAIVGWVTIRKRRSAHNNDIDNQRAILAGEKNADGTLKVDKFAPEPEVSAMPRRNKSVKDRLMGPLYRGSMIDLPPMPQRARIPGGSSNRASTMTVTDETTFLNKPWTAGENSPRPSFSSKRATRMMMMM